MLQLIVIIFLSINVQFIHPTSLVKSKSDVSNFFEVLGYSPVCVASALATCERFAKPDCRLHVLYLVPELKSILEEIKCNNKHISAPEEENDMEGKLKLEISEQLNNFSNKLLQNETNILERKVTKNTSALEKTEKLEQNFSIKNLHNDLLAVNEPMECLPKCFLSKIDYSKFDTISENHTHCAAVSLPDGVITVYPYEENDSTAVEVLCDQTTDGGGWTVIQHREALPVRENFYRSWNEYVKGFGCIQGEFWLGLENIHALTNSNSTQMELRVDLEDFEGVKKWARYESFVIGDVTTKYALTLGNYSGDAGDSLSFHNGMKFSTYDQDNDEDTRSNCAQRRKGAWWYQACAISSLNGYPLVGMHESYGEGIIWFNFRGHNYSLKKASMKVRPKWSD